MLKLPVNKKTIYENYHKSRTVQKKVIGLNNFTYKNILGVINKYLKKGDKILDLGCGVGTISIYLASKGFKVSSVDISEKAIVSAKESARKILTKHSPNFMVLDISKKSPKGKFDLVLIMEVLEHLENDSKIVGSIHKKLSKNGIVIATAPSIKAPLYRLGLLNRFDRKVGHLRRYESDIFEKLFITNGFKILETKKTEGIIRSVLYSNDYFGYFIKFLKGPISNLVIFLDNFLAGVFGESDIIVVAQKK